MSQQPRFPALLYFPDGGVLHCSTEAALCTWSLSIRWSDLFDDCWLVDQNGVEWSINAIAASRVSYWQRLRHFSRQDQERTVQVEYKRIDTLSLRDLKDRTLAQIDRDPGDLMTQHEGEKDLRAGVTQARSIRELIDYLGQVL